MTFQTNKTLLACAMALAASAASAASQPAAPANCIDLRGQGEARSLDLVRGKSVLKRFCSPASQVTVGAPGIANVVVPNASEVVIVARSVGSTNLIVSSRDGRSTVIDLNVGLDTAPLRAQFDNLFPDEKGIRIGTSGNALVLSGMVTDAAVASQLIALASAYQESVAQAAAGGAAAGVSGAAGTAPAAAAAAAPTVLNMLAIAAPQQVMLEVKIAEVSKSLVDRKSVV